MVDDNALLSKLQSIPAGGRSPLLKVIVKPSHLGKSGFPFISEDAYKIFLAEVPHLFRAGQKALVQLKEMDTQIATLGTFSDQERGRLGRSIAVIATVIKTAGITAPPDLWILRQVVETYQGLKFFEALRSQKSLHAEDFSKAGKLDPKYFYADMNLLVARGLLVWESGKILRIGSAEALADISRLAPLDAKFRKSMVNDCVAALQGEGDQEAIEMFCRFDEGLDAQKDWVPYRYELELGLRVLPIVLATRLLNLGDALHSGQALQAVLPKVPHGVATILRLAGYVDKTLKVTELGERVFQRGPGPFGIIHAYHQYLANHALLLSGGAQSVWVARGENVAASQDANRKTFVLANDSLDRYCDRTGFTYKVFIEHAVGHGEATRQRYERSAKAGLQYFGADLETAAIERAREAQKRGLLPPGMTFISGADIGNPEILIRSIEQAGQSTRGAVMLVGNGFHEIRDHSNEKMIEVFRKYHEAGILIVFTEESGLNNQDLVETAWNTYHAGFRYVHEISGQGLRPAYDCEEHQKRFSWRKCAELGGYKVLDEYCTRTRTIYPYPKKDGYNPSISVNYFCVI